MCKKIVCGPLVGAMLAALLSDSRASAQFFVANYSGCSNSASAEAPFRQAAGPLTRIDFESAPSIFTTLVSNASTLHFSVYRADGTHVMSSVSLFRSSAFNCVGAIDGAAVLNSGRGARVQIAFNPPVRSFGTWIFDDDADSRFTAIVHQVAKPAMSTTLYRVSTGLEGFVGYVAARGDAIERVVLQTAQVSNPTPEWFELDNMLVGASAGQSLAADRVHIAASSPSPQLLTLRANSPGATYALAGSLSGTTPGLPFGSATIPLNVDAYTYMTVFFATTVFSRGRGILNQNGDAFDAVNLPVMSPSLAGLRLHHAFVVPTTGFVSNPVLLQLDP